MSTCIPSVSVNQARRLRLWSFFSSTIQLLQTGKVATINKFSYTSTRIHDPSKVPCLLFLRYQAQSCLRTSRPNSWLYAFSMILNTLVLKTGHGEHLKESDDSELPRLLKARSRAELNLLRNRECDGPRIGWLFPFSKMCKFGEEKVRGVPFPACV